MLVYLYVVEDRQHLSKSEHPMKVPNKVKLVTLVTIRLKTA